MVIRRLAWQVPPPTSTSSATSASSHLQLDSVIASYLRDGSPSRPHGSARGSSSHSTEAALKASSEGGAQAATEGRRREGPRSCPVPDRLGEAAGKVYEIHAHQCPRCQSSMRPIAAVLPPQARAWIEQGRILPMPSTGPPALLSRQLDLPLVA